MLPSSTDLHSPSPPTHPPQVLLCACAAVVTSNPLLLATKEKAKVRVAALETNEAAATPADTKLLELNEKEIEIPTVRLLAHAPAVMPLTMPMPLTYHAILRKKRALVRTVGLATDIAAETPASTALLRPVVSVAVPKMVFMI